MKNSCEISKYATAKEVIDAIQLSIGDDSGTQRDKISKFLYRAWRKLSLSLPIGEVYKILPIRKNTMTVELPSDYTDWFFIGWKDECGRMIPIGSNLNLAPSNIKDERNICKNNCNDIRNQVKKEYFEEEVIIQGVPYKKTTSKEICADGSYKEFINEPISIYDSSGIFTSVEYMDRENCLCSLEKNDCGCIDATEGNLKKLVNCGSCVAACKCSSDNMLSHQVSNDGNGTYRIFEEFGYIQLSHDYPFDGLVLGYYSDALRNNGVTYFPRPAFEPLVSGTSLLMLALNRKIPIGERQWQRKVYYDDFRAFFRNEARMEAQQLIDIFDGYPKIPARNMVL